MSEIHERPDADELLANEDELLKGLLRAGEEGVRQTATVEIARKGQAYFRFRIRALSEDEYETCREKATVYRPNRRLGGIPMPERVNTARYRSLLIYTATVEEDRRRLWDSGEAQRHFNVLNGWDLIDKVLLAGEKDAIIERIDDLSGFNSEELEETAKN